jgi:O-antigen ligase
LQLHSVGHVNHSAIYLSIIFGASLGATLTLWSKSTYLKKLLFSALSIALFQSIILSQSRAAYLVSITSAVILILAIKNKIKIKLLAIGIIFGLIMISIISNNQIVIKQKEAEVNNNILANRNLVWNVPKEIIQIYPLFGIGMNNWKLIKLEEIKKSVQNKKRQFNPENYLLQAGHAHNLYLQATLERGLLGFASLIIFMVYWLKVLISQIQRIKKNKLRSMIWAGSMSAWLSTFLIGFFNSTFHHEHAILSCLFLGFFINLLPKKIHKLSTKTNS